MGAALEIGYLVHDLNDAAVLRRARIFEIGGCTVRIAGFCRDAELRPAIAARQPLVLGRSNDAALVQRALATLHKALLPGELRNFFAGAGMIVARNLEQLAIARSVAGSRSLVYECLDIHRSLTGSSIPARAVQSVEAALLPRCDALITSSPAFLREHFDHRPIKAPKLLIENKLLIDGEVKEPQPTPPPPGEPPLRIGWFGMLRCTRTLDVLTDLAMRGEGRIEVLIAGRPSPAELGHLESQVAATPHMRFTGPYTYADLAGLYRQCHFAWAIDWFEEGLNSSWLLPNRLYEAIAFGAIPIALADIELGRWLAYHNAGLRVVSGEAAVERLLSMDTAEIAALQKAVLEVDRGDVLCRPADCVQLIADLKAAVAA